MIRDERQYRALQERVLRFRTTLATLEAAPVTGGDPRLQQAGIDAMRAQLEALERELQKYETRQKRSP
jgi:hypothetical protein